MQPIAIVAYLALFATAGFLFVLACLLLGRLVRAQSPGTQKLATYECGEPAIGPGTVQFDLRFYVVALVFLIFEVEVALFFPPAVIFGQSIRCLGVENQKNPGSPAQQISGSSGSHAPRGNLPSPTLRVEQDDAERRGQCVPTQSVGTTAEKTVLTPFSFDAAGLAAAALIDLGVFFAVLLVGFAYLWRRGDLDWVRAVQHPATPQETAAMMSRLRRDGYGL